MTITHRLLLGAALSLLAAQRAESQDPAAPFIRAIITAGALPEARHPLFREQGGVLDALYAAHGDQPFWDFGAGYTDFARAAIATLRAANERGLDSVDYDVPRLDSLLTAGPETDPTRRSGRDLLLSLAVARYLHDLRDGRVPEVPFEHVKPETPVAVAAALLERAGGGEPVEALAREVEPHLAQYRNLLRQLSLYRQLATTLVMRPLPRTLVRPGQRYAGRAELWRRLVAFGDLPSAVSFTPSSWYDSTLAQGVQRFQARHALTPDGVLGRGTREALSIPPAHRVHQITLALERLRWLPSLEGQRLLVVNVPAFELFAFDSIGGTGAPTLRMPVVTGGAFDHRTPVMIQPLRNVEFRPYWNVPRGILTAEILPAIIRDSRFLAKERMEVLGVRDSVLGDSVTPAMLTALQQGRFRVRQRPGPWNSLGLTKFNFPNRADVYFHGTPDTTVFHRARRDLSHGCIRLQDPAALAAWALREVPGWDLSRIDSALTGADTVRVPVQVKTAVLIFYTTAVATPEGGILFYEDIYDHDQRLQASLDAKSRAP